MFLYLFINDLYILRFFIPDSEMLFFDMGICTVIFCLKDILIEYLELATHFALLYFAYMKNLKRLCMAGRVGKEGGEITEARGNKFVKC